jgi:hypothetical protein
VNDHGLDPELAQERPRHAAGRHPCRGLPGRRPLEDVADVVEAVLQRTGKVGVAGPDPGDRRRALVPVGGRVAEGGRRLVVERLDGHHLRPVLPVAVADEQEDRRAERRAVPDPAEDLGRSCSMACRAPRP